MASSSARGVTRARRATARTLRLIARDLPASRRGSAPMLRALRFYQWTGLQALVRGLGPAGALQEAAGDGGAAARACRGPARRCPSCIPARGTRARSRRPAHRLRAALLLSRRQRATRRGSSSAAGLGRGGAARPRGAAARSTCTPGRLDEFRAMARGPDARPSPRRGRRGDQRGRLRLGAQGIRPLAARTTTAPAFAGEVRDVTEVLVERRSAARRAAADRDLSRRLSPGPRPEGARAAARAAAAHPRAHRWSTCADSDLCCGSAGIYNLLEPEHGRASSAGRRSTRIRETGARIVVTRAIPAA